jgi:adenosylmethionine-8-amino-7-oxononanoate aminotransferase
MRTGVAESGPKVRPAMMRDWVRHIWLDFQQMEAFEQAPMIITGGKGMRVWTDDGRTYIDAIGGAMVSSLGYGNETIRKAMHAAVDQQDFWPVLHSTTPAALRLARRLAELLPGDLNTAFLLTGGSEATETAMKMARQYHANCGEPTRFKVISRYWSYHGATMGALAASGVADRRRFEPLPAGFLHVLPPYCYRCPWGKEPSTCGLECADAVEEAIRYEGKSTVSAVIADPVMAAAGVLVPPKAYYQRLREICDRSGALLIFDEVLTGFGRTGALFACDYYDTVPDAICLGKGITSGYAPVAAVVVRDHVANAFRGDPSHTFLHGHTYGGYPLGCDTALAVIDLLLGDKLLETAREHGQHLGERLRSLAARHEQIGDVRGVGMLWGLEFVTDRASKTSFPAEQSFAVAVRRKAQELGLLTRGSLNVVIVAPTLTATQDELGEIVELLERAIADVAAEQ